MTTSGSVAGRRTCAVVAALLLGGAPAGAQNLVVNGDFSNGLDGWTTVDVAPGGFPGFPQYMVDPGIACLPGRSPNARLMINVPDAADGYVTQDVVLPDAPATLTLLSWNNLDPTTATVSIQTLGDGVVHDLESWAPPPLEGPSLTCSGAVPIGKSWDLTPFAGQAVALRLRAKGGTGYNGVIADFDDVAIVAVTTTTSTTTTTLPALCGGLADPAAVACLCEADLPAVCSEVKVPNRIAQRYEGICRTSLKAMNGPATRKAWRKLGKADRKLQGVIRAVGKLKIPAECTAALVERGEAVDAHIAAYRAAITP